MSVCYYFHEEGTEVFRPCGRANWSYIFVDGIGVREELYLTIEGIVVVLLGSFCWIDENFVVPDVERE